MTLNDTVGRIKKLAEKSCIRTAIQSVLALFSFCYALFFIRYNYYTLMNSDTSGELILGRLLSQQGGILASNWTYTTELRVINTQIIYKLVFMLLGDNWMMVRLVSNGIMLLMLAAGYLFMMWALGRAEVGRWSVFMIFLPFGANYAYIVVYGAFYVPHILFTFISVGLMAIAIKEGGRTRIITLIMLFLTALFSGLGGARQALICYIPAVLVGFLDMLIRFLTDRREVLKRFCITALAFFGNLVGVAINSVYFGRRYSFLHQSSTYIWEGISVHKFFDVLSDLIASFGMCFNDTSFMGVYGAINFLDLGFVLLVIAGVYVLILRGKELDERELFYTLFLLAGTAFCALVYSSSRQGYVITYWAPFMPLYYPVPFMALGYAKKINAERGKLLLIGYAVIVFLLGSHVTLKNPFDQKLDFMQEGINLLAADEVIESMPDEGFAPFWIGNNIVEYTNGKKDVWTMDDDSMTTLDDPDMISWLQNRKHKKQLPEGEFFVVTFARYLDETYFAYSPLFLDEEHMIYSDDHLTIYVFKDFEDYKETLKAVGAK